MMFRMLSLLAFICLLGSADIRAQTSMHVSDVRAASASLQDARSQVSRIAVDFQTGVAEHARIVETARTDLLHALDDVIRSLSILDDGMIVASDANRRLRDAQRAQNRFDHLILELSAFESSLRQIPQNDAHSPHAGDLLRITEDVHALVPRLRVALEGLSR